MSYLENIKSPDDFKDFSNTQLSELCDEVRDVIIDTVSKNGGHLASNLGVVELTVAMLKVFPEKENKIVWDVGHQSYTHKILTGRYNKIHTIRTEDGLSGFPKRSESEYDCFNVGHSSTSISAAYGISRAKSIKGESGHTIAVIGDGALTGGLAYEALNNAGRTKKNFIVVLNDNKMSISRNVGSVARSLSSIRIKPTYLKVKLKTNKLIEKIPFLGVRTSVIIKKIKKRIIKVFYKDTLFDNIGFNYYGTVDGHNLEELENAFNLAKTINGPVLLHIVTKKGKGYQHAENDPKNYHGVSCFDVESGESTLCEKSFSDVFGEKLVKIANKDKKVIAITAAMQSGTGLNDFAKLYKGRFFDVGIAEEHAITFACGMATEGIVPVFAVYSTFLQRGVDQIIHDATSQQLHIVLAIDRAGVVGEDGETHQGVFDVSLMNAIPNLEIYSPCYFDELKRDIATAIYSSENVVAVRYPRGCEGYRPENFECGNKKYDLHTQGVSQIAIVTYGRLFSNACIAQNELKKCGINVDIIKLNRIKPIPAGAINLATKYEKLYFFEEGMQVGGVGEHFLFQLNKLEFKGTYNLTAIDNTFVKQASISSTLAKFKLDSTGMIEVINGGKL